MATVFKPTLFLGLFGLGEACARLVRVKVYARKQSLSSRVEPTLILNTVLSDGFARFLRFWIKRSCGEGEGNRERVTVDVSAWITIAIGRGRTDLSLNCCHGALAHFGTDRLFRRLRVCVIVIVAHGEALAQRRMWPVLWERVRS